MPFERRDVEASLVRKGFVKSEGDHSFFTYHSVEGGKTSVWTKTSHGTGHKTLGDKLVSMMGRQCGLTHGQFKLLIECPMSQEKYQSILLETGRIKQ
jgi:hypothetical protein